MSINEISDLHLLVEFYSKSTNKISKHKYDLYENYTRLFSKLGYKPLFEASKKIPPSAFIVKEKNESLLIRLKEKLNLIGIESSVYYGNGGYFLPLHQNIGEGMLNYIVENFHENYLLCQKELSQTRFKTE